MASTRPALLTTILYRPAMVVTEVGTSAVFAAAGGVGGMPRRLRHAGRVEVQASMSNMTRSGTSAVFAAEGGGGGMPGLD